MINKFKLGGWIYMKIIYIVLTFLFVGNAHVVKSERIKPEGWYVVVNEVYIDNGFTEVIDAVKKAEQFYKGEIELPTRLPPISFTHVLGRFNDGVEVPRLEITYLDENSGYIRYKILITKVPEYRLNPSNVPEKIELGDGNEILYYNKQKWLDTFIVEKKGFEYSYVIDKKSSNKISVDGIVEIIKSMR